MTATEQSVSGPCPSCSGPITDRFNFCPHCGQILRNTCLHCRASLEEGWQWCPSCGHRLNEPASAIPTRVSEAVLGNLPEGARSNSEELNQRGVELYEAEKYADAIEQFRRALSLDPTNSLYHCNLAVAYGESGESAAAYEEYQRALEFNPSDVTAHLNLGYYYNEQEEFERARREWERVIEISPHSAEAEEARDNLSHVGK